MSAINCHGLSLSASECHCVPLRATECHRMSHRSAGQQRMAFHRVGARWRAGARGPRRISIQIRSGAGIGSTTRASRGMRVHSSAPSSRDTARGSSRCSVWPQRLVVKGSVKHRLRVEMRHRSYTGTERRRIRRQRVRVEMRHRSYTGIGILLYSHSIHTFNSHIQFTHSHAQLLFLR